MKERIRLPLWYRLIAVIFLVIFDVVVVFVLVSIVRSGGQPIWMFLIQGTFLTIVSIQTLSRLAGEIRIDASGFSVRYSLLDPWRGFDWERITPMELSGARASSSVIVFDGSPREEIRLGRLAEWMAQQNRKRYRRDHIIMPAAFRRKPAKLLAQLEEIRKASRGKSNLYGPNA